MQPRNTSDADGPLRRGVRFDLSHGDGDSAHPGFPPLPRRTADTTTATTDAVFSGLLSRLAADIRSGGTNGESETAILDALLALAGGGDAAAAAAATTTTLVPGPHRDDGHGSPPSLSHSPVPGPSPSTPDNSFTASIDVPSPSPPVLGVGYHPSGLNRSQTLRPSDAAADGGAATPSRMLVTPPTLPVIVARPAADRRNASYSLAGINTSIVSSDGNVYDPTTSAGAHTQFKDPSSSLHSSSPPPATIAPPPQQQDQHHTDGGGGGESDAATGREWRLQFAANARRLLQETQAQVHDLLHYKEAHERSAAERDAAVTRAKALEEELEAERRRRAQQEVAHRGAMGQLSIEALAVARHLSDSRAERDALAAAFASLQGECGAAREVKEAAAHSNAVQGRLDAVLGEAAATGEQRDAAVRSAVAWEARLLRERRRARRRWLSAEARYPELALEGHSRDGSDHHSGGSGSSSDDDNRDGQSGSLGGDDSLRAEGEAVLRRHLRHLTRELRGSDNRVAAAAAEARLRSERATVTEAKARHHAERQRDEMAETLLSARGSGESLSQQLHAAQRELARVEADRDAAAAAHQNQAEAAEAERATEEARGAALEAALFEAQQARALAESACAALGQDSDRLAHVWFAVAAVLAKGRVLLRNAIREYDGGAGGAAADNNMDSDGDEVSLGGTSRFALSRLSTGSGSALPQSELPAAILSSAERSQRGLLRLLAAVRRVKGAGARAREKQREAEERHGAALLVERAKLREAEGRLANLAADLRASEARRREAAAEAAVERDRHVAELGQQQESAQLAGAALERETAAQHKKARDLEAASHDLSARLSAAEASHAATQQRAAALEAAGRDAAAESDDLRRQRHGLERVAQAMERRAAGDREDILFLYALLSQWCRWTAAAMLRADALSLHKQWQQAQGRSEALELGRVRAIVAAASANLSAALASGSGGSVSSALVLSGAARAYGPSSSQRRQLLLLRGRRLFRAVSFAVLAAVSLRRDSERRRAVMAAGAAFASVAIIGAGPRDGSSHRCGGGGGALVEMAVSALLPPRGTAPRVVFFADEATATAADCSALSSNGGSPPRHRREGDDTDQQEQPQVPFMATLSFPTTLQLSADRLRRRALLPDVAVPPLADMVTSLRHLFRAEETGEGRGSPGEDADPDHRPTLRANSYDLIEYLLHAMTTRAPPQLPSANNNSLPGTYSTAGGSYGGSSRSKNTRATARASPLSHRPLSHRPLSHRDSLLTYLARHFQNRSIPRPSTSVPGVATSGGQLLGGGAASLVSARLQLLLDGCAESLLSTEERCRERDADARLLAEQNRELGLSLDRRTAGQEEIVRDLAALEDLVQSRPTSEEVQSLRERIVALGAELQRERAQRHGEQDRAARHHSNELALLHVQQQLNNEIRSLKIELGRAAGAISVSGSSGGGVVVTAATAPVLGDSSFDAGQYERIGATAAVRRSDAPTLSAFMQGLSGDPRGGSGAYNAATATTTNMNNNMSARFAAAPSSVQHVSMMSAESRDNAPQEQFIDAHSREYRHPQHPYAAQANYPQMSIIRDSTFHHQSTNASANATMTGTHRSAHNESSTAGGGLSAVATPNASLDLYEPSIIREKREQQQRQRQQAALASATTTTTSSSTRPHEHQRQHLARVSSSACERTSRSQTRPPEHQQQQHSSVSMTGSIDCRVYEFDQGEVQYNLSRHSTLPRPQSPLSDTAGSQHRDSHHQHQQQQQQRPGRPVISLSHGSPEQHPPERQW